MSQIISSADIEALEAQLAEVARLDWPGVPVRIETMLALTAAARRAHALEEALQEIAAYPNLYNEGTGVARDALARAALAAPSEEKP